MAEDLQSPFNNEAADENIPEPTNAPATITIANDLFKDDMPFDTEDMDQGGVWTDYKIVNRYEADGQIYMMPVTSPDGFDGDQVAFVKLAAGTMLWIVDGTCERVGARPALPNPDVQDANLVLMDKHWEPMSLLMKPDSSIIYRVSFTYVYGFKNPDDAKLFHGRPPWMDKNIDCELAALFKDGIITCNTSTGGTNPGESPNQGDPGATATFADLGIKV